MDAGNGRFVPISEPRVVELKKKAVIGVFSAGERLVIKGSSFKVDAIWEDGLHLKLLPWASAGAEVVPATPDAQQAHGATPLSCYECFLSHGVSSACFGNFEHDSPECKRRRTPLR